MRFTSDIDSADLSDSTSTYPLLEKIYWKTSYTNQIEHFVNSKLDSGKIILQKKVRILRKDARDNLAKRILIQEHKL